VARALLSLALAGCAATGPAELTEPIINGTSDAGKDPAVVLVRIFNAARAEIATCSGVLIAPRVVLSAAHCADGTLGDRSYAVLFADSYDPATRTTTGLLGQRGVDDKWVNPMFDENDLNAGFDMALLHIDGDAPGGVAPLPIDRTRAVAVGTPVRMVGFGLTSATSMASLRIKLTAGSRVTVVAPRLFQVDGHTSAPCNGDSGGPAFVTVDGKELVAGVVSFGDQKCDVTAGYTFVAKLVADIDAFVERDEPDAFGQCGADGLCGFGCTTLDPDCPCAADGSCTTDCSDADLDPDCPTGCNADGHCTRAACPAHDPDCLDLPVGAACRVHDDCASDLCIDSTCAGPCDAGGACPAGLTCSKERACVHPGGGCAVGGGGGGWAPLVLLLLGLHRRRHHVRHRRQRP